MAGLEKQVLDSLSSQQREAFEHQLSGRNLEQALGRLRRIAALLEDGQELDGLDAARATSLDSDVCKLIVQELDVSAADLSPMLGLAAWVARSDYRMPIELFTVNYDLLIEDALESLRVPYFDGFVGNLRARFHTDLVEGFRGDGEDEVPRFFARLWKLHGSVNWEWDDDHEIVRLGQSVQGDLAAAIYPSDTKYEESRRVPFVVLQDRLRRSLQQPETLVLIAGYSFGDDHLNEMLFDAAAKRERSEFVVFCYSTIPEVLAERALRTPNLQVVACEEAILGGVRGSWKEPDEYPPDLWVNGSFALGDFRRLGAYLARSSTHEPERDPRMRELLAGLLSEPPRREEGESQDD